MDVSAPVSTIMTKKLITVNAEDNLEKVKEIFDNNRIHHIPVVRSREIEGIVSKTDYLYFIRGYSNNPEDQYINAARLKGYKVRDIMTSGLAKVESSDKISVALEVFKLNLFHAIPVVDNKELVGIVTTHDIIKKLAEEG